MPSFAKVVIDTFSVMDKLRIWEQVSCWVVPKHWDAILLWSFVCFDLKDIWILGQVIAYPTVGNFVQSLSEQGIRDGIRS